MRSRALRVMVVLLAAAALGGAGYFVYRTERMADASREEQARFQRDVARLQATLGELRGALGGYVADGQDRGFWTSKVSDLLQEAQTRVAMLEGRGVAPDSSQEIGTAEEALVSLRLCDAQARQLLRSERSADASRLLYRDASQLLTTAAVGLSRALTLQASAVGNQIARRRWLEVYVLAAAAGLCLLFLVLLLPRATAETGSEEPAPAVTPGSLSLSMSPGIGARSLARDGFDLALEPVGGPSSPRSSSTSTSTDPAVAPPLSPAADAPGSAAAAGGLDLAGAAQLCTDLARVSDTEQLRQLLGRAASLLDASGIVVWQAADGGTVLRPAFSYGYTSQALSRMQVLGREEENAVSTAFREGRVELVTAGGRRSGALVAPLQTPAGCVGAMAAETRQGAESRPEVRALAAIIAAQLATLMPAEPGEPSR